MGGFPSGQRGQTVNLLQIASVVRIHHRPSFLISRDGAVWKLAGLITRRSVVQIHLPQLRAQIAQLVEQRTENPRVVGSIPTLGTFILPFSISTEGFFHIKRRCLSTSSESKSSIKEVQLGS